jgi:hypothetical protein
VHPAHCMPKKGVSVRRRYPLQGGYYAWFRVFDNKLKRRVMGEYAEQYTHDGDSCGIHSSGAGFDRVDKADMWVPPKY